MRSQAEAFATWRAWAARRAGLAAAEVELRRRYLLSVSGCRGLYLASSLMLIGTFP